jgi:hypothetical protein
MMIFLPLVDFPRSGYIPSFEDLSSGGENMKTDLSRVQCFLLGMGRSIDLGSALKTNLKPTFIHSDAEAIRSDWEKVGASLYEAMEKFENAEQ